jgi:D-alanine-D-alanine ligase
MKIGLTYDLRSVYLESGYSLEATAEFDSETTVNALIQTLEKLGHTPDLIGHIHNLVSRLASGSRWDLVFNIAEGVWGYGREAQVPCLLEAYRIPYTFSDPLTLSICLHKGTAKQLLRDLTLPTAPFCIIENEDDIRGVHLPFPLFVKPVAEGTGKGINEHSLITNRSDLFARCGFLLERFHQPVLVERYLGGREFTVGIIGTGDKARVAGVLEIFLQGNAEKGAYSFVNKEECEERVIYKLASDQGADNAALTALDAWKGFHCRDAGRVDLKMDEHHIPCVMEINPLAGLHPAHSDLPILCAMKDIPYEKLIQTIIDSAMERAEKTGDPGFIAPHDTEVSIL